MEKGTGISIKMRRTIMGKWRNYVEKLKETCKNNKKKVIGICTGLVLVLSIGGVSYAINIQDTGATVDNCHNINYFTFFQSGICNRS